ncbi:MAG: ATP-binding cassette domain-containing protein [Gammaproteobacteria bacterium]|nr:ATP-binding cassette domain-containing protein [Gammaproteobacteria bacterium]
MIEVQHLTRYFGRLCAVGDVSFKMDVGEVLGFLGPNGAGKSTTMKLITGFLTPSEGRIFICWHDLLEAPILAKQQIGYLPEGSPSYGDMTVLEFLNFIAGIRALSGQKKKDRLEFVIVSLHLEHVLPQSIETLSKGYKRRVGLAQAIIHDPSVLILDEPTDGLDPNQKHEVRELIKHMAKDKIIIVSTHILEEVAAVCTRTIVIDKGKVIVDCTPKALMARSRYYNAVTLKLTKACDLTAQLKELNTIGGVEVDKEGKHYTVLSRSKQPIFLEIQSLIQKQALPVEACYIEKGRLDEVFRSMTVGDRA